MRPNNLVVGVAVAALVVSIAAHGQQASPSTATDTAVVMTVLNDVKVLPKDRVGLSLTREVPRNLRVRLAPPSELRGDFPDLIQQAKATLPRQMSAAVTQANDSASKAIVTDSLGGALAQHQVRRFDLCADGPLMDCVVLSPPGYSRSQTVAVVIVVSRDPSPDGRYLCSAVAGQGLGHRL